MTNPITEQELERWRNEYSNHTKQTVNTRQLRKNMRLLSKDELRQLSQANINLISQLAEQVLSEKEVKKNKKHLASLLNITLNS
jgi:arsenate reductase-like glutaredoxin family protein